MVVLRYIGIYFMLFFLLFSGCQKNGNKTVSYSRIQGETMGTTYSIYFANPNQLVLKSSIDSLLEVINNNVSTYIPNSTISGFNQSDYGVYLYRKSHKHFLENFKAANEVYRSTGGAFDPTVMPLVNYWGFGYDGRKKITKVDSLKVDSLKGLVGLNQIELTTNLQLKKPHSGIQLDFSACAKGYGVDEVGRLLELNGINDYLVEIGREVRAKGTNDKGKTWNIGIALPKEGAAATQIQTVIPLDNGSIATSGNYQNYYEVEGIKYAHTINPGTGFPEKNQLLSASVFASECMLADAYATAFMVMGLEKSLELASTSEGVEAYFIYGDEAGGMKVKFTEGIKDIIPN